MVNIDAQTHADATSQEWKGFKVEDVLGNSAYPDDNNWTSGYPFILFNVGTGRFVVQGGDWGMEGRLFYSEFGRTMYLYNNGRINSGLTENGVSASKNSFCCRPPEPFSKKWSDYKSANLTTLMDGEKKTNFNLQWHFVRVEDPSNTETFTYYMYLTSSTQFTINAPGSSYNGQKYASKNFYLGAAYGEWHVPSGKGDGEFVFLDDDRSCWTTANVIGNTNKLALESGDEVEIQKLYQWRLISVDEFIRVLNEDGVGLNPSASSLVPDRDFTRNSDDFYEGNDAYDHWTISPLNGYTYATGTNRYTYTSADYQKKTQPNNNQWLNNQRSIGSRTVNEAWDSPVMLKVVFDRKINTIKAGTVDDNVVADNQSDGMKNAKFGFLPFEGVGTISTNFLAPKPGWYQIECVGFSMSSEDHDAYLFARVIPNDHANDLESTFEVPTTEQPHYGRVTLQKLPFGTYSKNTYPACLEVGKELLFNANDHKQKVWVLITQADWDNNERTVRVGIGKDQATQSQEMKTNAFYDTDWACVDDIRVSYMGMSPIFFYDDEEDLNYLSHAPENRSRFDANEYKPAAYNGHYGGATNLLRKFTKNEWNTFSFPMDLTGEQIRSAFGDTSELLRFHSVGLLSNNDCIIDFQTVDLLTTDNVVAPGNIYLLKPSKDPSFGVTPRGGMEYYYDLGRMYFSTDASNPMPDSSLPVLDLSVWKGEQTVDSYLGLNDGTAHVVYTQTPGFSSFRVNKDGDYTGVAAPEHSYAPKGSYAMSGGKMYELAKDTRIKGFRGWITLSHSIFDDETAAADGARIAIDGIIDDGSTDGIEPNTLIPVNPAAITGVYDLSGRRLDIPVDKLPKGLYIVNGKKLLVK
ncbi:MAG: hypothetical protein IKX36_01745 [Prevotella sp.]|nr:hypothetical protein [Prevotella sp.]